MSSYGALSTIVAAAGVIMAASFAIGMAWMRRARWMPPEEDLPRSTASYASLGVGIIVAILYVFAGQIANATLATIAIASFVCSVAFLSVTIFVNNAYGFDKKVGRGKNSKSTRVLGGFKLSAEARRIHKKSGRSVQALFEDAQFQPHLVWSTTSRAALKVVSALSYLLLQALGSIALATAALLLSRHTQ